MALHTRKPDFRHWLRSGSIAILGAAMLSIPVAAAHAVFTASAYATVTASTLILAAPDPSGTSVTASCTGKNKKHQLNVFVNTFAPVPGANYHSLTIKDPNGVVMTSSDLSTTAGLSYSTSAATTGIWTYEIRGDYRVPNTANVWIGRTLKGTVVCS